MEYISHDDTIQWHFIPWEKAPSKAVVKISAPSVARQWTPPAQIQNPKQTRSPTHWISFFLRPAFFFEVIPSWVVSPKRQNFWNNQNRFYGLMPFMSANQRCQSTEGREILNMHSIYKNTLLQQQTHTCLTAFFQNNLDKPAPERLNQSWFYWSKRWWGGSGISWTICKSFAPRYRYITMPAPHHSIFTGWMLFLMPNQQRQSTEDSSCGSNRLRQIWITDSIRYGDSAGNNGEENSSVFSQI